MEQVLRIAAELAGPEATTAVLTPAFVARFIASRPTDQSRNTTLSLLSSLRAACTYAQQMGMVRSSPFLLRKVGQWVRAEKSRRPRQHIGKAEIVALLARAKDEIGRKSRHSQATPWALWRAARLNALVHLAVYTGARKNELLKLKVADVDLAAGFIHIVDRGASRLKTVGSERSIPIAAPLAEVLADWLPSTGCEWAIPNSSHSAWWQGGSPGFDPLDRLQALGRRAGIPDLTFHALRHSFATHSLSWGLTPSQIARILGHTRIQTQAHYIHEDRENLRELVDRFNFGEDAK